MKVQLRRATPEDCEALAPQMRAADALEVKRASGLGPLEALRASLEASEGDAGVLIFDGEIAAMYGVAQPSLASYVAVPWLLTSHAVERHKIAFYRIAKAIVGRWAEEHPVLLQMVDAEYAEAQSFLQSIGFKLFPPQPHGVYGAAFRPALRTNLCAIPQ